MAGKVVVRLVRCTANWMGHRGLDICMVGELWEAGGWLVRSIGSEQAE